MMGSYVAVNLETTGLNPETDKVIEIGTIKVVGGQMAEELHTMVHLRRQLEEGIVELVGIGDGVLRDAPGIEEIIGQVVAFYEGFPLMRHRIMLDYSFLKRTVVDVGLELKKGGADTLELYREPMLEEERKNLEVTCRYFRVETGTVHRVLSDAQAASGLCQELARHREKDRPEVFEPRTLIYKVKRE